MTALPKHKMTVDDFFVWAATQPGRWELFDGVPAEMSSERVIHGRVKYLVARAFERAIERAGVPCQFLLDSVAVRIDRHRCYQPGHALSIVYPDSRLVIHHARGSDAIATLVVRDGSSLKLDPPGLGMAVAEFFPPA